MGSFGIMNTVNSAVIQSPALGEILLCNCLMKSILLKLHQRWNESYNELERPLDPCFLF